MINFVLKLSTTSKANATSIAEHILGVHDILSLHTHKSRPFEICVPEHCQLLTLSEEIATKTIEISISTHDLAIAIYAQAYKPLSKVEFQKITILPCVAHATLAYISRLQNTAGVWRTLGDCKTLVFEDTDFEKGKQLLTRFTQNEYSTLTRSQHSL